MTQRVTLKIKTTGKELVHVPDTREIDNTIGHFSLKSEYGGGWASIERELTLFTLLVDAAAWPQLRELLLEEAENGGSTILLK
jgi:hypothetical protein